MKALYRRAATNAILAKDCDKNAEADVSRLLPSFSEAQDICSEAKADLLQVLEAEPQNKEARAELKAVQAGRRAVLTCV